MTQVFMSIKDVKHDDYKWIDARFSLKDEFVGKQKYAESHVVGAVHWDLNDDLSDMAKQDGRQPMPEKDTLTELFRSSGLELDDPIVIYDDGGSPFATRAWWFLQYAGFKQAFILREGFGEIQQAGVPVTNVSSIPEKTFVSPVWNEDIYASREFVEKIVVGETAGVLLDARAAKRYRGEFEPLDPIAGHIPGALNFDWEQLIKNGAFELDESTKSQLEKAVDGAKEITVYCGSGVTAAPVYAALTHYGFDNVRLYVGSYSDWISKEGAVVEKE